ncbi:MAG TPA: CbiX/SirB N-terminal domain-containing protein [Microlunatus sp.]
MTAPSLILLSADRGDRRVTQVSQQIREELLGIRPQLDVQLAYAGDQPTALQVVGQLTKRKAEEVVLVPLLLSEAFTPQPEVPALLAQIRAAHPGLNVVAARPIGPEAQLLTVIDRRLRDALRARRVSELDGLVFSAGGSRDVRSNALVSRRARQWASHHRLPCVTAFATGSGPSTGEAIRTLRGQGRRHIAVGSWFLAPGESYRRQAEQALETGAIAVSAPLGSGPEIAEAALARYVVAALELVDLEPSASEDEGEGAPQRHLSVVSA